MPAVSYTHCHIKIMEIRDENEWENIIEIVIFMTYSYDCLEIFIFIVTEPFTAILKFIFSQFITHNLGIYMLKQLKNNYIYICCLRDRRGKEIFREIK